jgi:hypothetical protein
MAVLVPAGATGTRVGRPGHVVGEYSSGRSGGRVNGIELDTPGANGGLDP